MATRIEIPAFRSEKEEADWWDRNPDVVTRLFERAKTAGRLRQLQSDTELTRLLTGKASSRKPRRAASRAVTIRVAVSDLESAQSQARTKGLPYQTYVKMLLHEALKRESAPATIRKPGRRG